MVNVWNILLFFKKVFKFDINETIDNNYSTDNDTLQENDFSFFYTEHYFKHLLAVERERAERSKKPFMLMLLGIGKIVKNEKPAAIVKKILKMLEQFTRKIDFKGWYTKNSIIGILYTEIKQENKDSIMKKINDNLDGIFLPEERKLINVTCLVFPEEENKNAFTNYKDGQSNGNNYDILYDEALSKENSGKTSLVLKRGIDILASMAGILLLSLPLTLIAILIKCTSKGPVFFKQERIGEGGRAFTMYKFRSMYVNNDDTIHKKFIENFINNTDTVESKKGITKIVNDPRITRIGKVLRKTSFDELPQLFNVLIGDMSLVGPRPPLSYEVEQYDMWHKRRVLEAKPGITGLWQVTGRSRTKFDDMVRLDIRYIIQRSLWLDLKLLMKTPFSLFKGAY